MERSDILCDFPALLFSYFFTYLTGGSIWRPFPLSGQNFLGTFRVTTMDPPMNICGDTALIFTNSSVTMASAISTSISTNLSSSKSYGGRVRRHVHRPRLFSTTDICSHPRDHSEGGDVRSSGRQRLRIQWRQHGAPVLARTRARRWQRRRILVVSVSARNIKTLP